MIRMNHLGLTVIYRIYIEYKYIYHKYIEFTNKHTSHYIDKIITDNN